MIGGVSVFLNQLLLTSDLHFHTCAVKSSSDQVKVSCIMSCQLMVLNSDRVIDLICHLSVIICGVFGLCLHS